MNDQKNMILAIVLSAIVLIGWQYFVGLPQMEKQKQEALLKQQQQKTQVQQPGTPGQPVPQPGQPAQPGQPGPQAQPGAPAVPGAAVAVPGQPITRAAVIAATPRVMIETPLLRGSIALKGGRIDDLALTRYRETVDPKSPAIVLLTPSGAPNAFYAEFGWTSAAGVALKLPGPDTLWTQRGSASLGVGKPVTLSFDNGEGLEFRRTITVDDKYLFKIDDQVVNKGAAPVVLYPYALLSRHGLPTTEGYYILHEGPIGLLEDKLREESYSDVEKKKSISYKSANAWLGFTDKYWAATLIPDPKATIQAKFAAGQIGTLKTFQADYYGDAQTVAPGATTSTSTRLFAGAKEVAVVDGYETELKLDRFDRLIDWGYFYFVTKPMFMAIHAIFQWIGNFGLAILIITVLIKIVFFPLANKSYASMAKMKAVQPEMMAIRERYGDDKVKQQQALMELYKKEKINPLAGCLPILIQVPVFFALYKVLFISLEMRHAPFYGWIKDLSAPDPTNIFNLFGLIPWDPTVLPVIGSFLHLGFWPIVMGITMWIQMKLNPAPPDPTQKMIFDWMPLFFTFMLASFSAGLVIYWAWNNLLSVCQQSVIMRKHGAKIELIDNLKELFGGKKGGEKK